MLLEEGACILNLVTLLNDEGGQTRLKFTVVLITVTFDSGK